jgi:xanthine dehydrogenase small subunit
MSEGVRFLLDGEVHETGPIDPTLTVLQLLRERLGRTGTKEGCAEGDCGACTVLVGEAAEDAVAWRAMNACILFAPMIDGRALMTVESLSRDGALNPVQEAMVCAHASQCGFCTPGFVMSIQGRVMGAAGTDDIAAADLIAGNLCRCTGYGPILQVAEAARPAPVDDAATRMALDTIRRDAPLSLTWADPIAGIERRWISPRTTDDLAAALIDHPDAVIVSGATDVGLWVTKQGRAIPTIVSAGEIAALSRIEETEDGVRLGAGVRYVDARQALTRLSPDLGELVRRIGALQVRNSGTIGGNIANGSPIGDMPPALIALGATLTLRRGGERRTMPLEDFFLDYGKQDRAPGEFVEWIDIPRPAPTTRVRIAKLSKRFDSDISAVCSAFALGIEDGEIVEARVAFGGMAGTPRRAAACETALVGQPWSTATLDAAARALDADFSPLTDVRGSSAYRQVAAANLVRGLWDEDAASLLTLEPVHG